MVKKSTVNHVMAVLLSIIIGFIFVSQQGCEKMKGGTEVVGFPRSFADIAQKVSPAVVNISTTTTVRIPPSVRYANG